MNSKIPIWSVLIILAIIIGSILFGGNHFYNEYTNEIEQAQKKNDSILKLSQKKSDSLIDIANTEKDYSDQLREQNDLLQSRNNNLYYEIRKMRKKAFVIDTSFTLNAKRIAESSDRFYRQNDSLRRESN